MVFGGLRRAVFVTKVVPTDGLFVVIDNFTGQNVLIGCPIHRLCASESLTNAAVLTEERVSSVNSVSKLDAEVDSADAIPPAREWRAEVRSHFAVCPIIRRWGHKQTMNPRGPALASRLRATSFPRRVVCLWSFSSPAIVCKVRPAARLARMLGRRSRYAT